MKLYVDTRQQKGKHELKHNWLVDHGYELVRKKLDVGDYMIDDVDISIDTKRNVDELAANINGRNHARFRDECKRAQEQGIKLVVLVENAYGYERIQDVAAWTNGHCKLCRRRYERGCNPHALGKCPKHNTRKPIQGPRLMKAMKTMEERYGVKFMFCHPRRCGEMIDQILRGVITWQN